MIHAFIKKGCFQDSVSLMIISRKLSESENVDDVSVMMGTPAAHVTGGMPNICWRGPRGWSPSRTICHP